MCPHLERQETWPQIHGDNSSSEQCVVRTEQCVVFRRTEQCVVTEDFLRCLGNGVPCQRRAMMLLLSCQSYATVVLGTMSLSSKCSDKRGRGKNRKEPFSVHRNLQLQKAHSWCVQLSVSTATLPPWEVLYYTSKTRWRKRSRQHSLKQLKKRHLKTRSDLTQKN